MVEVISPSNKAESSPFRALVVKAVKQLQNGIHLLMVDLVPPGKDHQQEIHGAIWEEITGKDSTPLEKPLALTCYESAQTVSAFIEPVAVGDDLPSMPLFLEPGRYLLV